MSSIEKPKAFIRAFFSYTIILVRTRKTVLTLCNRSSIATIPATRIDPPETGDGNYA
jgi:hypothetical protein